MDSLERGGRPCPTHPSAVVAAALQPAALQPQRTLSASEGHSVLQPTRTTHGRGRARTRSSLGFPPLPLPLPYRDTQPPRAQRVLKTCGAAISTFCITGARTPTLDSLERGVCSSAARLSALAAAFHRPSPGARALPTRTEDEARRFCAAPSGPRPRTLKNVRDLRRSPSRAFPPPYDDDCPTPSAPPAHQGRGSTPLSSCSYPAPATPSAFQDRGPGLDSAPKTLTHLALVPTPPQDAPRRSRKSFQRM